MTTLQARTALLPYLTAAVLSAALISYGVTRAFVWDEGFHLVAAQLIQAGKRPYLDFCFPQTPFNAYWNAAWMSIFGDSWRVTHFAAALLLSATLFLTAHWALKVFRDMRGRAAYATANVLLLGASVVVFQFGPCSQAYAMCMFCSFAAFLAVRKPTTVRVLLGGLLTGAGAASSLLVATAAPVLLIALAVPKENRWRKVVLFLVACSIPFAPVIWLFWQNPQLTFFNVVRYQALFRRQNWGKVTNHDADVLTSWIADGPSLLLILFGIAGAVWIWKHRRSAPDLLLCLAVGLALALYISTAHPTFARYYIVGAPFYATAAAIGFFWFSERLFPTIWPGWIVAALGLILTVGIVRFLALDGESTTWAQYERIAAKIAQLTPKNAEVFADEHVYFLLHWTPPPGMEFSYSHKLAFPPAEETKLHIISEAELKKQTADHRFAVFETCDDDKTDKWQLDVVYPHKQDFDDCTVYW